MDTVRIGIRYRPLRIAWVIDPGNVDAFRTIVRFSYALWGGRFNPVLLADDPAQCQRLIEAFQPDLLWPVGSSDQIKSLIGAHPHPRSPLMHESLYVEGSGSRKHGQVLDIYNAIVRWAKTPRWRALGADGVIFYTWDPTDPLADVFLVHFGALPNADVTGLDFRQYLLQASGASENFLPLNSPIPADSAIKASIPQYSRFGLKSRRRSRPGGNFPGFFVGDVTCLKDLVEHWNLRAADIPLLFVDLNHEHRYAELAPAWERRMREFTETRHPWERDVCVWFREASRATAERLLPDSRLTLCHVSDTSWNGLNVKVPVMVLGESNVLGTVSHSGLRPSVSFTFGDKPFSADSWFDGQRLVASASFGIGLYDDSRHTLEPPYIPELNEYSSREMSGYPGRIRIEHGRLGVVIDVTDTDTTLWALRIDDLFEQVFGLGGYKSSMSNAGLITRQLITQVGGLQGGRVFKIPGVRRLIRTYGPLKSFTKAAAHQLIGATDPQYPNAKFSDHEGLYIEARDGGTLTAQDVFGFLVEKGLFRIGAELRCGNCRMLSWTALDFLKQRMVCEMCGAEFDATRQLVGAQFRYRRSGILGSERNAQGAVPVALTLQQLGANFTEDSWNPMYSTSLTLTPNTGVPLPTCEVDFVWIIPRPGRRRAALILGECKDQGPIPLTEFKRDVDNLRQVADALPRERFETFVLLSKLAPFTAEEIECARGLNDKYRLRAILLTDRELEPYEFYERMGIRPAFVQHLGAPDGLASVTYSLYFQPLGDTAMIGQDD